MESDVFIKGKKCKVGEVQTFRDASILCSRQGSTIKVEQDRVILEADVTGIDKIYFSIRDRKISISDKFKDFEGDIDNNLMPCQLLMGYIPYPFTLKKNVMKAPPGLYTVITEKGVEYKPSPQLRIFDRKPFKETDFRSNISSILLSNYSGGLVSSFSGGYDSLFLTQMYAKQCRGILHFSEDKEVDVDYYKKIFPRAQWHIVGIDTHFTDRDVRHYFESVDEPCCDPSGFAEYLMVREIKTSKDPIMNGQSMDGVFANGRKYFKEYIASFLPSPLQKLGNRFSHSRNWFLAHYYEFAAETRQRFDHFYTEQLVLPKELELEFNKIYEVYLHTIKNDRPNFLAAIVMMLRYSVYEIEKIKTSARAYGLRYYLPIVSTNFVDYAFSIPASRKVGFKLGKKVLIDNFPEITNIKFISRDFIPNKLKQRLMKEKISEPRYKKFFIDSWLKHNA